MSDLLLCKNCRTPLEHFSPISPPADAPPGEGGNTLWRNYTCAHCQTPQQVIITTTPPERGWAATTRNPHSRAVGQLWDVGD